MADRYERKYVEKEKLTPLGCICKRDNRLIRCVCGYTIVGRLRRTCPAHLNVMYLHDLDCCPSCKRSAAVMKEIE